MKVRCKKIVYVLGPAHSGTTLLGMMLGSTAHNFFAGELESYHFPLRETHKLVRTCRLCGLSCPVWSTIEQNINLFEAIAAKSECSTIIDTSKKIKKWIAAEERLPTNVERALIVLTRDIRGITASHMRKRPSLSIDSTVRSLILKIDKCMRLKEEFEGPTATVRYEDLVNNPESTLQKLCDEIDLPYAQSMLSPWDTKHHPLRCNSRTLRIGTGLNRHPYYVDFPKNLTLDERWKSELTDEQLQQIKVIANNYHHQSLQFAA